MKLVILDGRKMTFLNKMFLVSLQMLDEQYKVSSDIKSTLTVQWNKSTVIQKNAAFLYGLGNQYIFVCCLQVKYLSTAGRNLIWTIIRILDEILDQIRDILDDIFVVCLRAVSYATTKTTASTTAAATQLNTSAKTRKWLSQKNEAVVG